MARYEIAVRGRFLDLDDGAVSPSVLDEHLQDITDELLSLEEGDEALFDVDVSAKLATGEVEFSIVVEAETPLGAARKGSSAIRCAVHAAGGHTPGWAEPTDEPDAQPWGVEYEGSSQRVVEPA